MPEPSLSYLKSTLVSQFPSLTICLSSVSVSYSYSQYLCLYFDCESVTHCLCKLKVVGLVLHVLFSLPVIHTCLLYILFDLLRTWALINWSLILLCIFHPMFPNLKAAKTREAPASFCNTKFASAMHRRHLCLTSKYILEGKCTWFHRQFYPEKKVIYFSLDPNGYVIFSIQFPISKQFPDGFDHCVPWQSKYYIK